MRIISLELGLPAPTGSKKTVVETTVRNVVSLVTPLSPASRYHAIGYITERLEAVQLDMAKGIIASASASVEPEAGPSSGLRSKHKPVRSTG